MRCILPDFCLLMLLLPPQGAQRQGFLQGIEACLPAGALAVNPEQAAGLLACREPAVAALDAGDDRLPWHKLAKRHHARRYCLLLPGAQRAPKQLADEGFAHICQLPETASPQDLQLEWEPLPCDRRGLQGPFDIIGDLHGCCDELETLLLQLGYEKCPAPAHPLWGRFCWQHPAGRRLVFLGDLADRGPCILDGYKMVAASVAAGHALCVPGNHDIKFRNYLQGRDVALKHGLEASAAAMEVLPEPHRAALAAGLVSFIEPLPRHLVLDEGRLVVAHAGLEERLQLRDDDTVRRLALWGPTSGETDPFGLPVRINWAARYQGRALVVYGHTPVQAPAWQGRTVNIDTGCVFGGSLTALRYPELETRSVPARKVYSPPPRPIRSVEDFTSGD